MWLNKVENSINKPTSQLHLRAYSSVTLLFLRSDPAVINSSTRKISFHVILYSLSY